ncbi:MAG: MotA/TolQ/ExbB proton channel family protein [Planctomycetota bacterium]
MSAAPAASGETTVGLWPLFAQSFDVFTVVLLAGSAVAVTLLVRAVLDLRSGAICSADLEQRVSAAKGDAAKLRAAARDDEAFVGPVLEAALSREPGRAAHEAAELAAGERLASWMRKIEPLQLIGNAAPLVGLAGTVWGMILAFTSLGASGGAATPGDLSVGIAKALFHTLLGLCLAIPTLVAFSLIKASIERQADRALSLCARAIDAWERNADQSGERR